MATTTPPGRQQSGPQQPGRQQSRPLQGSWEGILDQASEFAGNGNDKAVPLFQKAIDGLAKLPQARRQAANNRLQTLYMRAVIGLQSFYASSDRFDDAIAVVQAALPHATEQDRQFLESHLIDLQFLAGHNEAALQSLRQEVDQPDSTVGAWGRLVWGYVRSDRPAEALALIDEFDRQAGDTVENGPEAEQESQTPQPDAAPSHSQPTDPMLKRKGALDGLRAISLLEMGDIDGGIEYFERAAAQDNFYKQNPHLLYARLSTAGRYEEALHYIQRDSGRPARAGFWRGLTYLRQGRKADAQAAWRGVAELDMASHQDSAVEHLLARYYLGDPNGEALNGILSAIRENQTPNWLLLYLAGIGFAVRGDLQTAQADLKLAVSVLKSTAEGKVIPQEQWFMVKDLFAPEVQETLSQYFELPLPKQKKS